MENKRTNQTWEVTPANFKELNALSIPEKINISGFQFLPQSLLYSLPQFYNCGTIISIDATYEFKKINPTTPWRYQNVVLLPGQEPKLWRKKYPNWTSFEEEDLIQKIENFNNYQINRVYNHNTPWDIREDFYKKVFSLSEEGYQINSPSEKTVYEYYSEKNYQHSLQIIEDADITQDQIDELLQEGVYYGVEVPEYYKITYTRKTKNGYTEEPSLIISPTKSELYRNSYNSMLNSINIPKSVRQDIMPQKLENKKALKEAYDTLQYLKSFGDEFLQVGYHRCPICNNIYNENKGCGEYDINGQEIKHIPAITIFNADKLLYGVYKDTFEDFDVQKEYFRNKR